MGKLRIGLGCKRRRGVRIACIGILQAASLATVCLCWVLAGALYRYAPTAPLGILACNGPCGGLVQFNTSYAPAEGWHDGYVTFA